MGTDRLRPYFLLSMLVGSGLLLFFVLQPFLIPLVLAAISVVVLRPVHRAFERALKGWPALAALATLLFGVVCALIPLSLIGTQVVAEARHLLVALSDGSGRVYLESVLAYAQHLLSTIPGSDHFSAVLATSLDAYTKAALSWVVANLGTLFSGVTHILFALFIYLIALYYLLRDGAHLRAILVRLSPLVDTDDNAVLDRLELSINSVVRGNLTLACIQGVLSGIGLTLFGVPNPILWGVAAALAALVPGLGTSLVLVPATAFLFLTGALWPALGLLLWAVLAVGLIDNLLGPRLVGRGARLHPLMVMLSVLGGLVLFGPAGVFLGPLSASLLLALTDLYAGSAVRA